MFILVIVLMVAALSSQAQLAAQVDDGALCDDVVPVRIASQQQIDGLSTLIVFNRSTSAYTYLGQRSDQVDFPIDAPSGLKGAYLFDDPYISPAGTKLLHVYIDSDMLMSLSILDLLDSSLIEIERVSRYSSLDAFPIYWANDDTIAVSVMDSAEGSFRLHLIDAQTALSVDVPVAQMTSTFLPQVSPDLTRVAYVDLHNREERLVISSIRTQDMTIIFSTIDFAPMRHFSWSPDSEHIAVITNRNSYGVRQNLIVVDMEGHIMLDVPLTHATDYPRFDANIKWSPDGQWIAYETGDPTPVINVLNLEDLTIASTCLSGESFWSPDGSLLAIIQRSLPSETPAGLITKLLIYDPATSTIYEAPVSDLDNVGRVLGWARDK